MFQDEIGTICTHRAAKSKVKLVKPDGSFNKDPEVKELAACLARVYNLLDEKGDFRKDEIRKQLDDSDSSEIDVVMKMCLVKYPMYKETAYHMMECFFQYLNGADYFQ